MKRRKKMEALGLVEVEVDPELESDQACLIDASGPTHEVLNEADAMCQNPACNHFLTAHTRGTLLHNRCLMVGCQCAKANLTEAAQARVKRGVMP